MRVKCFHLGAYGTNCFLAYNENNIAYFFDCGGRNLDKVYDFISEHNLNLKYIVLTHGHGDHIEGLNDLASHYPEAKVYIGEEEKGRIIFFVTGETYHFKPTAEKFLGKEIEIYRIPK